MAGAVAMRAVYEALGCSPQVADYLIDEEELEDVEDLAELEPADVRQLCKNIRNPGGGGSRSCCVQQGYAPVDSRCSVLQDADEGWPPAGGRQRAPWRCAGEGKGST